MLSILNNLSALNAENSLSLTQGNLQKTLTQLSTGLRINSGADDAAGLSIADGLTANIAALTQSSQNATNGVGQLQTADGALSQVTTLLDRAITLATEGANGGLDSNQSAALNTEFSSIKAEIDQIGQTTDFNGQNVFSATSFASATAGLTTASTLQTGSVTSITDTKTGGIFSYTAQSGDTVATLETAVATAVSSGTLSAGTTASINSSGNLVIATTAPGDSLNVSTGDTTIGALEATAGANNTATYISDGTQTSTSDTTIQTSISAVSSAILKLTSQDLSNSTNAASALTAINNAINAVSAQRGAIGASVNRLTAAANVITAQVQNLTSASNSIENANVGQTVANLTQYNILQSTGITALQQANAAQQNILHLFQ